MTSIRHFIATISVITLCVTTTIARGDDLAPTANQPLLILNSQDVKAENYDKTYLTAVPSGVAEVFRVSAFEETTVPPAPVAKDEQQSTSISTEPNVINPFAERVEYNPYIPEEESPLVWETTERLLEAISYPSKSWAAFGGFLFQAQHHQIHAPLDDHAIGLQPIPRRPDLIVETNEPFLDVGVLEQGIELPTGAVWRPAFWVFGTYRTGISYFDNRAGTRFTEWSNRLDLFGQLNLTGTERLVVGVRPLDKEVRNRRDFSSYDFNAGQTIDGANTDVQTLFFEGDFGELFPNIDPDDSRALDYGFSVGRQPMSFQQGLLINEDMIDAVTVTRNTLNGNGNLNLRATMVYAVDNINRNNNLDDRDARMVGLFTESDIASSTINADIVHVHTDDNTFGSLTAVGLSGIQRFHGFHNTYNTSLHLLASFPGDGETAASGQGELLFAQTSWTMHESEDVVYLNGFWAIDQFTSPARGPLAGGPLGQTGILFAAPGLGRFGAPLSNQASDAFGGSLGYQIFYDETRQQLTVEIGGRKDTNQINAAAIAAGGRYQRAIGQHWIMILDGSVNKMESREIAPGARVEFLAKF